MTCIEIRIWTIACDSPGCDALATGEGEEPWPEGWDAVFAEGDHLTPREALRHACPEHAERPPEPVLRPTCTHEWFAVRIPGEEGCERCEAAPTGRRAVAAVTSTARAFARLRLRRAERAAGLGVTSPGQGTGAEAPGAADAGADDRTDAGVALADGAVTVSSVQHDADDVAADDEAAEARSSKDVADMALI